MAPEKHKWLSLNFFVGLLIGAFIGVFVVFLLNNKNNGNNKSITENMILGNKKKAEKLGDEEDKLIVNNKATGDVQKTFQTEVPITYDTLSETDTSSFGSSDSAIYVVTADTLLDTLTSMANLDTAQAEEVIIVRKDKLIKAIKVELKVIAKRVENSNDSLLSEVSGIVEHSNSTAYLVEFWSSPINYKGYKMANNKVLLYGMDVFNEASLYELNGQIYMKHLGDYYILDNTFAFKQFNKLTDEAILAALH